VRGNLHVKKKTCRLYKGKRKGDTRKRGGGARDYLTSASEPINEVKIQTRGRITKRSGKYNHSEKDEEDGERRRDEGKLLLMGR